jgi:ABC-2 type transport system permease protein
VRLNRLAAVARKEVLQIVRDSRSLAIVVVLPVVMMLLLGYGVSLDMKHLPVWVLDREASPASRELVERFRASEYFRVLRSAESYDELVAAIDSGRAKMGLVVPHDFSARLAKGEPVGVQALVDASDDNTANVLFGYAEAVVRGYATDAQLEWMGRRGMAAAGPPVRIESRAWYNEELESSAFIVPGVLAVVMAVIGAFLTALTIAREWERGTMEQLIATPVTPLELLVGKLGPYFVVGMGATAICVSIGIGVFDVPFRGSLVTLFFCSALFLTVVLCQGYFISVVAKSQLAASQAALISTFLPAFLLSGFLFSIQNMPAFIRGLTHVIPAKYYVSLLKDIFLKGTPLEYLLVHLVPLAIFSTLLAAVATRAFRKRLA